MSRPHVLSVLLASGAVLSATGAALAARSGQPGWADKSPHREGFVTVAPNVRLHYLDWGGTGEPLVFLTGLGNSAHSFDDLATQFTDRFHVVALTRRGQAESSKPTGGPYDIRTLTDDIKKFLDTLNLDKVTLVGHSFGGQELTHFANAYPNRLRKLIYLDAGYDYVFSDSAYSRLPASAPAYPAAPAPLPSDCVSPEAFISFSRRTFGIEIPEAEMRVTFVRLPDGSCGRTGKLSDPAKEAMARGIERQNYKGITVPALALYAVKDSLWQEEPWLRSNLTMQANYARLQAMVGPIQKAERARFAREVRHGKVVELHGAHHWIFVSNRPQVVREMREFLKEP